jgi:hypothetical protein
MAEAASSEAFTKFSKLPHEIRLMIWKAALPPRIVSIRQKALDHTVSDWLKAGRPHNGVDIHLQNDSPHEPMLGLASDYHPPQILFVCKESYGVASKYYHRAFSMVGSIPEIYFDFQRDTLYLRHDVMEYKNRTNGTFELPFRKVLQCLQHIKDKDSLKLVENLALLVDCRPELEYPDHSIGLSTVSIWVGNVLQAFGGVKHLTLVVDHYVSPSEGQSPICFMEPIDVGATLSEIGTYEGDLHGDYSHGPDWYWLGYEGVTKKGLELYQTAKLCSCHEHWSIPTIEHKVVVTENLKEQFEAAARNCEEKFRGRERVMPEMSSEVWLELEEQVGSDMISQTVDPNSTHRSTTPSFSEEEATAANPRVQDTIAAVHFADEDFSDDDQILASIQAPRVDKKDSSF